MDTKILRKIQYPANLAKTIDRLKKNGKTVVLCHGVFDLIHLGHIRHFNLAKKEGDVLVISITEDKFVRKGPGRPIFNEQLRAEALASLSVTDYVSIVNSPTATDFIRKVKPDVYVKGGEYQVKEKDVTGKIYEEEEAITSVGGRLAFTDDITFSSSNLINTQLDVYPPRTVKYLKAIGKRFSIDDIQNSIDTLKKLKVLVIGDAIIDEYAYCIPMGKSSKAEIVVNKYLNFERFAGGVLATANNVASVCENVDMLTVLGEEETYENFITRKLNPNINPLFFYHPKATTTLKRRYVSDITKRKLFQICHMEEQDIPKEIEAKVLEKLRKVTNSYDLVISSDFGHGLLTRKIIDLLSKKSKYLAINVQTNGSNAGFNLVTKYPKANCVCIDEMELRFATQDRFGDVRSLTKHVYQQIKGCEHIIATRGAEGSICYSKKNGFHETPAFSDKVVDAIGAGDAFFAYIAPCFAAGMPQELVSFIGNAVGSLAVQIVCNREPVNSVDLTKFITRLLK